MYIMIDRVYDARVLQLYDLDIKALNHIHSTCLPAVQECAIIITKTLLFAPYQLPKKMNIE